MKKLVRPLLAGAGLTGALAATNRALGNAPLPTNALGGTRRAWTWRGHEIFATENGSGPLVLLVHGMGIGASSYEFRRLVPLLTPRHRVLAIDLIGCGLSEKPRIAYTCELFAEQIADALGAFGDERTTVVASREGAAFAIRAAARAGARIERLVAISPPGLGGTRARRDGARGVAVGALIRAPVLGEAAYNALASRAALRWGLEHEAYAEPGRCTADVIDHYYAVAHQPGARYVPAAAMAGALECDLARDLPFLDVPLTLLVGSRAPSDRTSAHAEELVRLARQATIVRFEDSGLLPHEEQPGRVAAALDPAAIAP